jgi:hypothetical protein
MTFLPLKVASILRTHVSALPRHSHPPHFFVAIAPNKFCITSRVGAAQFLAKKSGSLLPKQKQAETASEPS